MKKVIPAFAVFLLVIGTSCGTSKTYFTTEIRNKVENNGVSLTKIQYFIDRDVELRREMLQGEAKVTSGKVKIVDGKHVNIITLKRNTPGICTGTFPDKLLISFEMGDKKYLTFGKSRNAGVSDPYVILANQWENDLGEVFYDGKRYYIQPNGTSAGILIKAKLLNKSDVEKREMKGRTVSSK